MAAENGSTPAAGSAPSPGFNEAAAHGRGKHVPGGQLGAQPAHASMRPRRMAAENSRIDNRVDNRGRLQ